MSWSVLLNHLPTAKKSASMALNTIIETTTNRVKQNSEWWENSYARYMKYSTTYKNLRHTDTQHMTMLAMNADSKDMKCVSTANMSTKAGTAFMFRNGVELCGHVYMFVANIVFNF